MVKNVDLVIAPDLYILEITNTAWKFHKITGIKLKEAQQLADQGIQLIDHFISSSDLWREALAEAINFHHPVYDLLYLICARRNAGKLLTGDQKLIDLAKILKIPFA